MRSIIPLLPLLLLPISLFSLAEKPTIWVYTDLSDPRDQRVGGHPYNDPDDICSLAALLLQANRFDIAGIVFSSTNRKGLPDATSFVEDTFAAAYARAVPHLNAELGGFQPEIPFHRSSIYHGGTMPDRFDPRQDYASLSDYPTVRELVDLAGGKPVYVLNWGPMTESAIAVKHCIDTGNTTALKNMTFISHWTMSYIAQGSPETPYKVANCRDDGSACDYIHRMAAERPDVKLIELGSVGQTGVVDGSSGFPRYQDFETSSLGQVFVHSKFYHGKPDQSDGSTFWLLTGAFGPTLEDYAMDGTLDQVTEERVRDKFLANGHDIIEDLRQRSVIAAKGGAFPTGFIAARFTYVYRFLDGRYATHLPYPATLTIRNAAGETVYSRQFDAGNHRLPLDGMPAGLYDVTVLCGGLERQFVLDVGGPS